MSLLLPGLCSAAVLELDEIDMKSSDRAFTMTLNLKGSSRTPLARQEEGGDIVVEVRNCVAGPSLSDTRFEEGLVRRVRLETYRVGGQPALRIRVEASVGTSFDRQLDRDRYILTVTAKRESESDVPGNQASRRANSGLDIGATEQSAGSVLDRRAKQSPWQKQVLSATLDDLQRELEESRARERAMRQELAQARRRQQQAETPNPELEAELERYRELVRQIIEQNEDLSRRLIEAQRVDPETEALVTELQATEARLQEQLQVAEQALKTANEDRAGLEGRLQTAQTEVGQLVEVNRSLSRQKDEAEAALADLRAQQASSQVDKSDVAEIRAVEAGLREQLQVAKQAMTLANQDRAGLEENLKSAQTEVSQLVDVNQELSRQKREAETALADLRAWQENSQIERSNLEEVLQSAREEIRQLVLLNASLRQTEAVASQDSPSAQLSQTPTVSPRNARAIVGLAASPCLRLRRRPGFGGEILNCLPPGTVVSRLEELSGWTRIGLAFGIHHHGWVAAPYLEDSQQQTVAGDAGGQP
jgi:myosin heavy subunit